MLWELNASHYDALSNEHAFIHIFSPSVAANRGSNFGNAPSPAFREAAKALSLHTGLAPVNRFRDKGKWQHFCGGSRKQVQAPREAQRNGGLG